MEETRHIRAHDEPTRDDVAEHLRSERDAGADAGSDAEQHAEKKPARGRLKDPELARQAATARWSKERAAQSLPKHTADGTHVLVPVELRAVIEGLRDAATKGSAPAAKVLREYMERFPLQQGGHEAVQGKALEDMTPEELTFAEAYLLHRVARAERCYDSLRQSRRKLAEYVSGREGRGAPPED